MCNLLPSNLLSSVMIILKTHEQTELNNNLLMLSFHLHGPGMLILWVSQIACLIGLRPRTTSYWAPTLMNQLFWLKCKKNAPNISTLMKLKCKVFIINWKHCRNCESCLTQITSSFYVSFVCPVCPVCPVTVCPRPWWPSRPWWTWEILKWLLICSQDLRGFVRKVR